MYMYFELSGLTVSLIIFCRHNFLFAGILLLDLLTYKLLLTIRLSLPDGTMTQCPSPPLSLSFSRITLEFSPQYVKDRFSDNLKSLLKFARSLSIRDR